MSVDLTAVVSIDRMISILELSLWYNPGTVTAVIDLSPAASPLDTQYRAYCVYVTYDFMRP